jgi:hypothetical protein
VGSITGLITVPGTTATYYVRAVDPDPSDPTGATRRLILTNHSGSYTVTENMLNVRPTTPILSITNAGGFPCLSWTNSLDVDALGNSIINPIRFYRIYRDSTAVGVVDTDPGAPVVNLPDPPYSDRIARAAPNQANSCDTANPSRSYYLDATVDPSQSWNYYVTAVDQDYLESFASLGATWTPPSTGP